VILINRTYEIVTEESAEHGDAAERGFISQDEPYAFRELVDALRNGEPSCYPTQGFTFEWVTVDCGETREFFERGERRTEYIHFSRSNTPHAARYWRLAMIAAGHVSPRYK
jgi:hypothetical protein